MNSVDSLISDYRRLEQYAEGLAARYQIVSGGDIMSRAYIKFSESGEIYSFDLFKKKISEACSEEVSLHKGEKEIGVVVGFGETEKQCRRCKEVLPVDLFYSFTKKSGQILKAAYCIKCDNEKSRNYGKTRRRLTYDKINQRNKAGRENLSAWYIMKIFRENGMERSKITPQMVLDKRKSILSKRAKKKAA